MSTPTTSLASTATTPVLRLNATYHAAPGTPADALQDDALNLMGIVEDIINTVAHGLCQDGDIAANRSATANLLFGAHCLLHLASGAQMAARAASREGGAA